MSAPYILFRTSHGTDFLIPNNPAALLSDAETELRTHPNLPPGEITFSYHQQLLSKASSLGSLDIDPDSYILINVAGPLKAKPPRAAPDKRSTKGDPTFNVFTRSGAFRKEDPPDFERRVDALLDLCESHEWTRPQCEKALRESFFDPNRAAFYLLTHPETHTLLSHSVEVLPRAASAEPTPPQMNPIEMLRPHKALIEELQRTTGVDRDEVIQVVAALEEVPEEEWKTRALAILGNSKP
jgi:hypothetical protein